MNLTEKYVSTVPIATYKKIGRFTTDYVETAEITSLITKVNPEGKRWRVCEVSSVKPSDTKFHSFTLDPVLNPYNIQGDLATKTGVDPHWLLCDLTIYTSFFVITCRYSYADLDNVVHYKVYP